MQSRFYVCKQCRLLEGEKQTMPAAECAATLSFNNTSLHPDHSFMTQVATVPLSSKDDAFSIMWLLNNVMEDGR